MHIKLKCLGEVIPSANHNYIFQQLYSNEMIKQYDSYSSKTRLRRRYVFVLYEPKLFNKPIVVKDWGEFKSEYVGKLEYMKLYSVVSVYDTFERVAHEERTMRHLIVSQDTVHVETLRNVFWAWYHAVSFHGGKILSDAPFIVDIDGIAMGEKTLLQCL